MHMSTDGIWQRIVELTDRTFASTSGIDLRVRGQWPAAVTTFLTQANERLDSIRVLSDKNSSDSSIVLTRSLFELAVNVSYIAKDASARLPEYLRHGGIPTTIEEAKKLQEELEKGHQPAVIDIIPGQAWRRLNPHFPDQPRGCVVIR